MNDIHKIITGVVVAAETVALGYVVSQNVNNEKLIAKHNETIQHLESDLKILTNQLLDKKKDKITKYVGMEIRVHSGITATDGIGQPMYIIITEHSSKINICDEDYVELRQTSHCYSDGNGTTYNRYGNGQNCELYYIPIDEFKVITT